MFVLFHWAAGVLFLPLALYNRSSLVYLFFGMEQKASWNIPGDNVSNKVEATVIADRLGDGNAPSFWALIVGDDEINLDTIFLERS